MDENPNSEFVLLLDMNCNIFDTSHCYTKMLREMMQRRSLISSFELVPNFDHGKEFTRFDYATGSFTLIDGILLSKTLSDLVSNVRISSHGDNVSGRQLLQIVPLAGGDFSSVQCTAV